MRTIQPSSRPIITLHRLAIPRDVAERAPVRWTQFVGSRKFSFVLEWNPIAAMYILAIWSGDRELVRVPVQYGWDLLEPFQYIEELRGIVMVPFDPGLAEMHNGVTRENLGKTVQIYYVERAK